MSKNRHRHAKSSIYRRYIFVVIALFNLLSVFYTLYVQYYKGIEPCPLCLVERTMIGIIGVSAFICAMVNAKRLLASVYLLFLAFLSGITIKIADHHLWLINLPQDQQPISCALPLKLLFARLPFNEFIDNILKGGMECSHITWQILGFSPPSMVLTLCIVNMILVIYGLTLKY